MAGGPSEGFGSLMNDVRMMFFMDVIVDRNCSCITRHLISNFSYLFVCSTHSCSPNFSTNSMWFDLEETTSAGIRTPARGEKNCQLLLILRTATSPVLFAVDHHEKYRVIPPESPP